MGIMTDLERKERIDLLNSQIDSLLEPSQFVLNSYIFEFYKEIEKLQKECNHKFVDGYCDYCYKAEEKE